MSGKRVIVEFSPGEEGDLREWCAAGGHEIVALVQRGERPSVYQLVHDLKPDAVVMKRAPNSSQVLFLTRIDSYVHRSLKYEQQVIGPAGGPSPIVRATREVAASLLGVFALPVSLLVTFLDVAVGWGLAFGLIALGTNPILAAAVGITAGVLLLGIAWLWLFPR